MNRLYKTFFIFAVLLGFIAPHAFADGVPVGPCGPSTGLDNRFQTLCDKSTSTPVGSVIGNVITILLTIAVILSLFFLIWGGIKWIMSGGDKTAVDTARKTIIAAILGLILTFFTFFIMSVIFNLFGLDLVKLDLTPLNVPVSKSELTQKCTAQADETSCQQIAGCYWSGSACAIKPH